MLQVGKTFELMNCDQHKNMIIKSGRDPGTIRPDITHQVMAVQIFSTPLTQSAISVSITTQFLNLVSPVSSDVDGQPSEQSRLAAGLHPHSEECLNRNQSADPHP